MREAPYYIKNGWLMLAISLATSCSHFAKDHPKRKLSGARAAQDVRAHSSKKKQFPQFSVNPKLEFLLWESRVISGNLKERSAIIPQY